MPHPYGHARGAARAPAQEQRHEQARLRDDLVHALDRGEVHAHFQPIVELATGVLVSFEALARWTHPVRGVVNPDDFIPIAEASGLMGRLGQVILFQACEALASWRASPSGRHLKVSVNVSPQQVVDPQFAAVVRDAIRAAGVPADRVCLEITESAFIDEALAAAGVGRLRAVGVQLALDDFGTGYSSLSRLSHLAFDYVKLDRWFINRITSHPDDAVVVAAAVRLAHNLGMRMVAEGVEDASQQRQLAAMGCEFAQGYLWSPAMSPTAAAHLASTPGGRCDGVPTPLNARSTDRGRHLVHLYRCDEEIATAVVDGCQAAMTAGQPILLVVTKAHRTAITAELYRRGLETEPATCIVLDAADTLAALLFDDMPDGRAFRHHVGGALAKLTAHGRPWIYGEMVGLLWDRGQVAATMRLERLWNELGTEVDFDLVCGYHRTPDTTSRQLNDVCAVHDADLIAR